MVDLTDPTLLTVQRAGTKPAVLARMVQFHELPDRTERLALPLAPTVFLAAFWTVSTNMTVAGPETEPVAVVVPPDTSHETVVGMTAFVLLWLPPPPTVICVMTGIG